jgi:hypothetical protein
MPFKPLFSHQAEILPSDAFQEAKIIEQGTPEGVAW